MTRILLVLIALSLLQPAPVTGGWARVAALHHQRLTEAGIVQAGLSCFIERHHGVELVGHSGDQNGFISRLYVHHPSRSGYIVSFNTNATDKADARRTTRAVDDDLRDLTITELFRR